MFKRFPESRWVSSFMIYWYAFYPTTFIQLGAFILKLKKISQFKEKINKQRNATQQLVKSFVFLKRFFCVPLRGKKFPEKDCYFTCQ